MTTGGASITLPLSPEARDPISALFYVRTLPMATASHFTLPLSDNGRRSRLEVTVHGLETISLTGKSWSAWKLEPRLSDRIERWDGLKLTTWVSADSRHIPLVVDVKAGFGSVRLELASYRADEASESLTTR